MSISLISSLIYAPPWFYGFDIVIDLLSLTVLLLIALFSFRAYRLGSRKTHLGFSISFLLLSFSFLAKVLSNFVLYYLSEGLSSFSLSAGGSFLSFAEIRAIGVPLYSAIFLYRALMIIGLYVLFFTYYRKKVLVAKGSFIPEMVIFVVLVLLFSYVGFSSYYLFHIVAFIILLFITRNYYSLYRDSLLKHGSSSGVVSRSLLVARSFGLITVSQLFFIFSNAWDNNIYAFAEIIQLCGYLLLLLTFIVVLFDGSKKKQD